MKWSIRLLYLYLFSFVGLLISIIGSIQLTDLAIKAYVFKVEEYPVFVSPEIIEDSKISIEQQKAQQETMMKQQVREAGNQRKRQISNSLSMIAIGLPVYLYHWLTIKKESKA